MNRLNTFQSNLCLLTVCVLSRMFTSIYYVEDIDSLRFALAIQEYSIINLQPHFPGYPVFCFLAKILFAITNSLGATFSLIGGLSTYIIIHFTLRLSKIELSTHLGLFCSAIIFLNPLLWLMSNRYMPDMLGAAVAMAAIFFLISKKDDKRFPLVGCFLIGVLAGTRLSYLPLMVVPVYYLIIEHEHKSYLLLSFILGSVVWLFPFMWVTGIDDLLLAATKQTVGHFTEFGGTSITENNWRVRLIKFFSSVWADGFGGYWKGRSWQTIILSIPLSQIIFLSIKDLVKRFGSDRVIRLMVFSLLVYSIWILMFQNVIHKSRHVIPIIMVLHFFIITTQKFQFWKNISSRVISILFIISTISVTSVLTHQHRSPSAVSKLKDDLIESNYFETIISIPLIEYYLRSHGVQANYIHLEDLEQIGSMVDIEKTLIVGNNQRVFQKKYEVIPKNRYYHNPYVNRMWPKIETFVLKKSGHES